MSHRWTAERACNDADPGVFFPATEVEAGPLADALEYCRRCPVTARCLAEALRTDSEGIWGGTLTRERKGSVTARSEAARGRRRAELLLAARDAVRDGRAYAEILAKERNITRKEAEKVLSIAKRDVYSRRRAA